LLIVGPTYWWLDSARSRSAHLQAGIGDLQVMAQTGASSGQPPTFRATAVRGDPARVALTLVPFDIGMRLDSVIGSQTELRQLIAVT
jgi:hypothetical protein